MRHIRDCRDSGVDTVEGRHLFPNVQPAMTAHELLHDYAELMRAAPAADRKSLIQYLDSVLPDFWQQDYARMTRYPGDLLVISSGDETRVGPFCRYLFDHSSSQEGCPGNLDIQDRQEDRVVAVWGTSRSEPAHTRDKSRMRGLLHGFWKGRFPGDDRGHFFAHTMGGGLDIPQATSMNRGGLWRKMERYCATNPGTFCFVRPIYRDRSWRPAALEYGIFKTTEAHSTFWGHMFDNSP